MYEIPGIEAGTNVRLGRCINVDEKIYGPDIFNPDVFESQEKNDIYFEYKQVCHYALFWNNQYAHFSFKLDEAIKFFSNMYWNI